MGLRFLGIDQSLRGTGVCLLEMDPNTLDAKTILLGTILTKLDGAARLSHIRKAVTAYLVGTTRVAMEGYSYGSVGRVFELGEAGGMIKLAAFDANVPCTIIPPTQLKYFATGSGGAAKKQMLETAIGEGAPVGEDDNQADAFFLALLAWHLSVPRTAKLRHRMDVIHGLNNPISRKNKKVVRRTIPGAI